MKGQPPDLKALEYEKSNERENKDLFLFCILFFAIRELKQAIFSCWLQA